MSRMYLPTDSWVRACMAPVLIFLAASVDRNYLADFWHHLARGRLIVESGAIIDHDQFTFTIPGRTFQDTNWLSQVSYFLLFRTGGLELVQLVNALVLAAAIGLLVYLCWRACGSMGVACIAAIFTFFGLWQVLTIRPQTFSLLLFVLLQISLDAGRRNRRWLWLAPGILALWVNLHGGFPIGLLLIGATLVGAIAEASVAARRLVLAPAWPLALCLALSCAATLLNPYGWNVYQYVGLTSTVAHARRIDEWMPPNLEMLLGKMWVGSLVFAFVAVALSRRRPTIGEVCLLVSFLPLAAGSARMVAWWLLVLAKFLSVQVAACLSRREEARPSWGAAATLTVLAVLAFFAAPAVEPYRPLLIPPKLTPPRLETELEQLARELGASQANCRVFTRFEWGEYLSWVLPPRGTVFMDGRIEIYPDQVWAEYATVTSGRANWQDVLDRYGVDALILDPAYHARTGLLEQAERSPHWEPAARTSQVALFVRRSTDTTSRRP